jgi:hypothetical protein
MTWIEQLHTDDPATSKSEYKTTKLTRNRSGCILENEKQQKNDVDRATTYRWPGNLSSKVDGFSSGKSECTRTSWSIMAAIRTFKTNVLIVLSCTLITENEGNLPRYQRRTCWGIMRNSIGNPGGEWKLDEQQQVCSSTISSLSNVDQKQNLG